ncbi:MAG: ATP-binding protein [Bacteroides sp.]
MDKKQLKRLPVGIQTFEKVIAGDYLYIDKTEYIWNMIHLGSYIFLSRPRRFGKSLLLSTLQAYFEGRKELFKGTYIERVEKEWMEYPVLKFDMSLGKHMDKEQLERYLGNCLAEYEGKYGITKPAIDNNDRLTALIRAAYQQRGKKVVILIDEYDAPLLDVVHEEQTLPVLRNVMRNFYSPLKASDPYLQFVFLTGITKFSQLSIFSELNNLKNISMRPDYATVCGISLEEMESQMSDYIDDFTEHRQITRGDAIMQLKHQYDGYRFSWPSPSMFNPYSLLNAFQDHDFTNYWFASGTPTYLIEMMRKFATIPSDISHMEGSADDFDAPTEGMTTIMPLLYQSGYITIKDYDESFRSYTLGIPNNEVRIGLTKALVPSYVMSNTLIVNNTARNIARYLTKDDIDGALKLLQTFLGTVPYCNDANTEGHYQQVLYIIFTLVSDYFADVEIHTPTGRVDMVLQTKTTLYLFELKLNKSAEAALSQIDLKDYKSKFALCGLPIVKVGINFDSERRTIGEWIISQCG